MEQLGTFTGLPAIYLVQLQSAFGFAICACHRLAWVTRIWVCMLLTVPHRQGAGTDDLPRGTILNLHPVFYSSISTDLA